MAAELQTHVITAYSITTPLQAFAGNILFFSVFENTFHSFTKSGCQFSFHTFLYSLRLQCRYLDCLSPPVVPFASIDYSLTTEGSVANYSCHQGYGVDGALQIVCQVTGLWTDTPVCIPGNYDKFILFVFALVELLFS